MIMKKVVDFIKHHIQELIVPAAYFFIVAQILVLTKTLILEAYSVTPTGIAVATAGAIILAKAVVMADKLPFINFFSGKPLILGVLWKTAMYGVLGFLLRTIEELIPLWAKHEGLVGATEHFFSEVSWPQFWVIQIWLMVALILYNSVSELDKHFGAGSMRKAFLGDIRRSYR
jgi:hypothetical protein